MGEIISYPVFKGLQKPLEFMGIRGKFIYYAAGTFLFGFIGFLVFNIILGFFAGLIALVVIAGTGIISIFIKQKLGLHAKKRYKGIVHYDHSTNYTQNLKTSRTLVGT